MKEFNRANLRVLALEIQAALDEVAKRHGIKISMPSGGRFSTNSYAVKIEAKTIGATGEASADLMFEYYRNLYDLQLTNANGDKLEQSYNSRAKEYPFIYSTVRGARYKGSLSSIVAKFASPEGSSKFMSERLGQIKSMTA